MNVDDQLNVEPTYSRREEHLSYVELSKLCDRLKERIAEHYVERALHKVEWQRERRELVQRIAELEQLVIDSKEHK